MLLTNQEKYCSIYKVRSITFSLQTPYCSVLQQVKKVLKFHWDFIVILQATFTGMKMYLCPEGAQGDKEAVFNIHQTNNSRGTDRKTIVEKIRLKFIEKQKTKSRPAKQNVQTGAEADI